MLRKIRLTLAVLFFALTTLLFLDFTGTVHAWFGWMAKIQFLPALLALNVGVVAALVLLTLLLGRVYCSVICPLGVFQDVVSWLHGRRAKNRFRHSPALSWLRWSLLILFVVALLTGVGSFVALLAPYSSWGRIAGSLLAPLYQWGNNLLALLAERMQSYAFYETEVWLKSLPTLLIALVSCVTLVVLAWRGGRTYCNTLCPVGTVLGFLSRYAWLRPVIDVKKCNGCGLCERNCKASCIDSQLHGLPGKVSQRRHLLRASESPTDRSLGRALGRHRPTQFSHRHGTSNRYGCLEGAGDEGGWRFGRHRGQGDASPTHAHRSAGCGQPSQLQSALHGLPAVRLGLP